MLLINDISFPPFVSLAVSPIENYLSPLPATWKWYFFSYLINFNLTDGYPVTFESKIVENNIFQRYNLMTIWSRVRLDSRIQIWLIVKRPFRLAHDWRWNSKGGPLLLLLLVSDSSRHIPFHRTIDALIYILANPIPIQILLRTRRRISGKWISALVLKRLNKKF